MNNAFYMDCFEKCQAQHEHSNSANLIKLIQENNCGTFSESMLSDNYTKLGLLKMLCGCLCGDEDTGDDHGTRSPPSPELAHTPPVRKKST